MKFITNLFYLFIHLGLLLYYLLEIRFLSLNKDIYPEGWYFVPAIAIADCLFLVAFIFIFLFQGLTKATMLLFFLAILHNGIFGFGVDNTPYVGALISLISISMVIWKRDVYLKR